MSRQAWLGSIPGIALRLATNLFHRDIKSLAKDVNGFDELLRIQPGKRFMIHKG
jgi:hypothetical protein